MSQPFAKVPGETFLKANKVFSGSHQGMRFRMAIAGEEIVASVWANPWCFAQAEQWIDAQYDADLDRWEESKKRPLG